MLQKNEFRKNSKKKKLLKHLHAQENKCSEKGYVKKTFYCFSSKDLCGQTMKKQHKNIKNYHDEITLS